MAYQYDVFISYKKSDVTNFWVAQFHKSFTKWLNARLDYEPIIFFDEDCIDNGEVWPIKLKEGIKGSKCILCIWTAEYFRSKWCRSEWESFEARDNDIFNKNKYKIIQPIVFADGENYPPNAQRRQQRVNVEKYASQYKAFWETTRVVELEDIIKDLCITIADQLKKIPDDYYDENFPLIEVTEEIAEPKIGRLKLKK